MALSQPRRDGHGSEGAGGPSRPMITVIAAIVLLGVGVLIGRSITPDPAEVADVPATEQPVAAQNGGPTRIEAGVPVGYPRTEDGAVAAATQYVAGIDAKRLFDDDARAEAVEVLAAEDARADVTAQIEPGIELALQGLGLDGETVANDPSVVVRSLPAGYSVESYSDDEAVIDVWTTVIFFAEGRQALSGLWSTERVNLRWERDDWRLTGFSSREGPTPPSTPTGGASGIAQRINAFDEYVSVPAPQ